MSNASLENILHRLHTLEAELETEIDRILAEKRETFRYTVERGKVRFERGIRRLQRQYKTGLWTFLREARIGHLLTAPVIYSLIIPFLLMDIMGTLYQHICFRVYGIPRVARRDYLIIDRHHLAYLNLIEKINCVYCGYGNGLIAYIREIAARTEQYWCPIKHASRSPDLHERSSQFVEYGDSEAYGQTLEKLRKAFEKTQ